MLILQRVAQVVLRFGKLRLQFHRLPKIGDRLVQASLLRQLDAGRVQRAAPAGFSLSGVWASPRAASRPPSVVAIRSQTGAQSSGSV